MIVKHKMGFTIVVFPTSGDRITVEGTFTAFQIGANDVPDGARSKYTQKTPHGRIVARNYSGGVKCPPVGWDKL